MNLRLTILFLSLSVSANAQYWYSQEISVGYGIVPSDQFLDGNRNAAGAGYISYENFKVSGMWFVNYKFFVGEKFSIGLFAGREQESGTMGAPYDSDEPVMPLGTFSRTAYTIASEISVQYRSERNTRIYATAGIGVTIEQETDVFQQAYYNNARQYLNYSGPLTGSETIVPNNRTHFNGYISPVGISVGNHLRGFFEIGFGYKGIFNGGISYYFCKGKKKPIELMTLDPGDVVILPHNYPIGKELKQIKEVW